MRDTNELCREIASTRRRLEGTADALRDRMSAKELFRPVTNRLRGTLGEGGEKILEAFRDHPLPLALVGIGLGWMMLRESGVLTRGASPSGRAPSRLRSVAREAAHGMGDAAGEVAERVGGAAGNVAEKVSGVAHQTREAAHQARVAVQHAGQAVRKGAASTADWFGRTLEENPLTLAAGALAAGLVAGLAIPVTEKEEEMLGSLGEDVAAKFEDAAQQALEKAPGADDEEAPKSEALPSAEAAPQPPVPPSMEAGPESDHG
jgi:hypothetical protein